MKTSTISCILATVASAIAQGKKYTIESNGIKAQFIPYGASLTNLYVKDKNGKEVDVVLGYDDADYYPTDASHPVYNSIPGRYVNRISNAQYKIGPQTFHTQKNDGNNTLHSGTNNWSFRNWNIKSHTKDSITFAILDQSNSSLGMIGDVKAEVKYSVKDGTWKIEMGANSPQAKTPLMLTQHTYFNLDAFKNPMTDKIWNHTLYMPYSSRYLVAGDDAIPTGEIATAKPGSINDFASRRNVQIGHSSGSPEFPGNCGAGGQCEGYNGYWLIDKAPKDAVVITLASAFSGIKAEMKTDQVGAQVYSCNWFSGTDNPLKNTQGLKEMGRVNVTRSSCVAIEAHDYVDGINRPEWGRKEAQLTGPGEKYTWTSSWKFSRA